MNINSYDELCKLVNQEFAKINNPTGDDLLKLSRKFNVDVSIIRECVGIKDTYDFLSDED